LRLRPPFLKPLDIACRHLDDLAPGLIGFLAVAATGQGSKKAPPARGLASGAGGRLVVGAAGRLGQRDYDVGMTMPRQQENRSGQARDHRDIDMQYPKV
jgi:hypothetical protein